jgi:DNA end-binding protein Ku
MESLKQTGKIGIAKVSIRSKSSLCCIRVIDRCLVMETIFYPDEVRSIAQVPNLQEQISVNDKELSLAKKLIDQLSTPFEPTNYKDDYREALMEAIEHKIAGEEVQAAPQAKRSNVIDLMAALQSSLEAVKVDPKATIKDTKTSTKSKRKEKVSS